MCFNQAQTEIKVVNLNPNLESQPFYGCDLIFPASCDTSFRQRATVHVNSSTYWSPAADLWPMKRNSLGAADRQGTLKLKEATAVSGHLIRASRRAAQ